MTTPTAVFLMNQSVEPTDPELFPSHPRNRGIDWAAFAKYAEHGTVNEAHDRFDIFVKTDRQIEAVWLAGVAGPIVSARLRRVLETVAGASVEFLPVSVNHEPFHLLRIDNVIDAFDLGRSEVHYYASGRIKRIDRPVWLAERINDPALFTTPDNRYLLWATPGVVKAYEESGCTGVRFIKRGTMA